MNKKQQLNFRYYSGWTFYSTYILTLLILIILKVDRELIGNLSTYTKIFFFTIFVSCTFFLIYFYIPTNKERREALRNE